MFVCFFLHIPAYSVQQTVQIVRLHISPKCNGLPFQMLATYFYNTVLKARTGEKQDIPEEDGIYG